MARYLGIGEETEFGSVASIAQFIDIISEDLNPQQNIIYAELVSPRDRKKFASGGYIVSGGVDLFVEPENFGRFLKWTLGQVSSTLVETGSYDHTFKGGDTIKSFTGEVGLDDVIARRVVGCGIDSMTVGFFVPPASKQYTVPRSVLT